MAVVNTKATAITNADASTQTNSSMRISGGSVKESLGTVEAANGDSIASVYRFARVKSGDRVSRVLLSSDAITSAAGDIGLYDTAANGAAAVDADFFGSAVSLASAQVNTDVTHESGVFGVEDVEQPLWQALGLSADPGKLYDVAVTLTAAAAAAGTISLKVQFIGGN